MHGSTWIYSAQKKQKLCAPKQGQKFFPGIGSQDFFLPVFYAKLQTWYTGAKKICPTLIGKNNFACFGAESFFFWALWWIHLYYYCEPILYMSYDWEWPYFPATISLQPWSRIQSWLQWMRHPDSFKTHSSSPGLSWCSKANNVFFQLELWNTSENNVKRQGVFHGSTREKP